MAKRKLLEDVDELFVDNPTWTSETKTVGIECHQFLKKIDDKKLIESPRFKLAGVKFFIRIWTDYQSSGCVRVDLVHGHGSDEDQTSSGSFSEGSGARRNWEMKAIGVNNGWGFKKFLTHEKYRAWAKDNGDVFKLRAEVTLHTKVDTAEDGWTRYCYC